MAKKKGNSARKPPRRASTARPRRAAAAVARVSASVDPELLAQAESVARSRRTTVAALVAEGLRKVVGAEKAPVLPPGDIETGPASEPGPWGQLLAWMEEQQATLTDIRNALGDVAASLPNDAPVGASHPAPGTRIPPP